jgi:hypothetical protein
MGMIFQERLAAHWANLNSLKWMLWNDSVEMVGIRNDQSANWSFSKPLADPEANSERFEGIEANLDEFRAYLYGNHESVTGYAKRTGTESVFRPPMRSAPSTN